MADELLRTKASPKWLGKQMVFILLVAGFAIWALVDATIVYPSRGEHAAEFLKFQYLKAAMDSGAPVQISVDDPEKELQSLLERQKTTTLSSIEKARFEWLSALRNANRLDASRTNIGEPSAARAALEKKFKKADQAPKALSRLDIPVQWAIFAVCGTISAAMIFVLLRAVGTVYRFDPANKVLTLPGGQTIAASDVAVFDKRKWDKFLIFLKLRENAPSFGGQEVRLDLLRHVPLEDWVLEMEKTAFPPAAEPEGQGSPSALLMTQPSVEIPNR